MTNSIPISALRSPAVRLAGEIGWERLQSLRDQLAGAEGDAPLVIALSTLGGDPEVARVMGHELRLARARGRRLALLGQGAVYSAGITLMGYFPRQERYLTRGTRLLIHERRLTESVKLDGPLTTLLPLLESRLEEVKTSIFLQNEGFAALVEGSRLGLDEVVRRAATGWYMDAEEALALELVAGLV